MLNGTYSVERVVEESTCRSTKDYQFTEVGVYQIHSVALMPNIPFGASAVNPQTIDSTIFLNAEETKLSIPSQIKTQNFLTTRYIGHAPLEFYNAGEKTKMGRQFTLICKNGIPTEKYRSFGTESVIRGYNRSALDTRKLPGGGEMA